MATDTLYETDFVAWTERQAQALREAAGAGSNLFLDWDHIAEEIETVGRSERLEVRSHIRRIVSHLLKLAVSPAERPRAGWESEIDQARGLLLDRLGASPSLRRSLSEMVADELPRARRDAARSLRKYGEDDAASLAETYDLSIGAGEVLDEHFYLPGTTFRREG